MAVDPQEAGEPGFTVTLADADLKAARRLLLLLVGDDVSAAADLQQPRPTQHLRNPDRQALIDRARAQFDDRRRRLRVFGAAMFGEPAWDMLLAVYLLDWAGPRQTIGSVLQFAGASPSTAARWLEFLERQGLVKREAHPTDLRTAYVRLSAEARELLDAYFSETAASPGKSA